MWDSVGIALANISLFKLGIDIIVFGLILGVSRAISRNVERMFLTMGSLSMVAGLVFGFGWTILLAGIFMFIIVGYDFVVKKSG